MRFDHGRERKKVCGCVFALKEGENEEEREGEERKKNGESKKFSTRSFFSLFTTTRLSLRCISHAIAPSSITCN